MDEPSTAGWHTGGVAGPYASMVGSARLTREAKAWEQLARGLI